MLCNRTAAAKHAAAFASFSWPSYTIELILMAHQYEEPVRLAMAIKNHSENFSSFESQIWNFFSKFFAKFSNQIYISTL